MSEIANWTYVSTAYVRPYLGEDRTRGGAAYGAEFPILCDWIAENEVYKDAAAPAGKGAEFVSTYTFYTEDPRVKRKDRIRRDGYDEDQEVRLVLEWNMAAFGQAADYKVVT